MSRVCELTGKHPSTGHNVSHSNRRTLRWWSPNLKVRTFKFEKLGQTVTIKLSTKALRTIDKLGGIAAAIRKAKDENLSPKLQKVKRALKAVGKKKVAKPAAPAA